MRKRIVSVMLVSVMLLAGFAQAQGEAAEISTKTKEAVIETEEAVIEIATEEVTETETEEAPPAYTVTGYEEPEYKTTTTLNADYHNPAKVPPIGERLDTSDMGRYRPWG